MRRTGRTTRMLLKLAMYISENWDKEKYVLVAGHSVAYTMDILERLYLFFPGAKRFAYTSITFGKIVVRPFNFSDLDRPEVMRGAHWDKQFIDHYEGEEYNA